MGENRDGESQLVVEKDYKFTDDYNFEGVAVVINIHVKKDFDGFDSIRVDRDFI